MAKTLTFKRVAGWSIKRWNRPLRKLVTDAMALPLREARFTIRRAKSIMRPKRKKPKSRYGEQKYFKRGKKKGQAFWSAGVYSRPGTPPLSDKDKKFNLRFFAPARRVSGSQVTIPHASTRGNHVYAYVVGPVGARRRPKTGVWVPGLHEHGGTVKYRTGGRGRQFTERGGLKLRHGTSKTVRYPKRPFMAPASKEARESAQRKSPHSMKKIYNLGGFKGRRMY